MSIEKSCPIEYHSIDLRVVRLNAFFVFFFSLLYLFTEIQILIYLVSLDFFIRVFLGAKYSPVCYVIKKILNISGSKPELINAGPKTFAAKIGLIFSLLIILFSSVNYYTIANIITIILVIASGLETFFNFCLACKVYPFYKKIF